MRELTQWAELYFGCGGDNDGGKNQISHSIDKKKIFRFLLLHAFAIKTLGKQLKIQAVQALKVKSRAWMISLMKDSLCEQTLMKRNYHLAS